MNYQRKLDLLAKENQLPPKLVSILRRFFLSYTEALESNAANSQENLSILERFLDMVLDQLKHPFVFEPFHKSIRAPIDYYRFGLDFLRPLIVFKDSKVLNLERVDKMIEHLGAGENIILFGNHQTEPDPQAISLLLEATHPKFAEEMIFVAGQRVISDPLCVPISKGCNLLCIFSKKYIETPPEEKHEKQLHNQKTMKRMSQLLAEGGKCIYVAPSGGRDRPNEKGTIDVAKFDPASIEMFWLMAKHAGRKTHFHPLALATYDLLPPPNSVEIELGEARHARCTPIHLAFGPKIDMEDFPGSENVDKKQKRQLRADYIWNLVNSDYQQLIRS